jgi:hypothetical protein
MLANEQFAQANERLRAKIIQERRKAKQNYSRASWKKREEK